MPSERPIAPSIVLISLSDFLPKFFVLSSSASVFGTRSAMVRIFAALKQLDARTVSSSSSTLRKRFSFRSVRGRGSARSAAASSGVAWGKFVSSSKWSSRIREASATAVAGATLPSVHTSRTSRSLPSAAGSTWKFTRWTGEKFGVQQDRVDGQRLGLALLGRHVAAAALDAHFHLKHAGLVERGERHVGREDLDVGVLLKVARRDRACPLRLQPEDLRAVDVQHEDHLPEAHHDVERVLRDPGQVRKLVEDMLDLAPRRRGPVDGRQEGPAVGDADREGEPGLEGLHDQLAVALFVDGPVVPRGKLEIQHADPLQHVRRVNATVTRTGTGALTLDAMCARLQR